MMHLGDLGDFSIKISRHLRKKCLQVSSTFFPHLQVIDPQKSPKSPKSVLIQEMMKLHSSCLFGQDIIAHIMTFMLSVNSYQNRSRMPTDFIVFV